MHRRILGRIIAFATFFLFSVPASACLCGPPGLKKFHFREGSGLFVGRFVYAEIDTGGYRSDRYARNSGVFYYKVKVEKNISSTHEQGEILVIGGSPYQTSCDHVPRFKLGDLVLTTGDFTNMCGLNEDLKSLSEDEWAQIRTLEKGESVYRWWTNLHDR
jgi:hypothetical protein